MSELKTTIASDAGFAKNHALRSAAILQALAELVALAASNEEVVSALASRKSAIVAGSDNAFLEEGIINFYLKSVKMNEEK